MRTSIDPRSSVATAMMLITENTGEPISVVQDGKFLGAVAKEGAAALRPDQPVGQGIPYVGEALDLKTPVRTAAQHLVRQQNDFAPVYDGDRFVGLVTARLLLPELGRSWDPMTGLSWSDALRVWGSKMLASGHEISLVFFDIDDFGAFNKAHGHVVGDRVIQAVSHRLESLVEGGDILVRYGGDEFVLGTARPRVMVDDSVFELLVEPVQVDEVPSGVRVSHGTSGGKRTKEREASHYAATLDNLITLASRACLASKAGRHAPTAEGEFVALDEEDIGVPTAVRVRRGENAATGFHHRETESVLSSVGLATADALSKLGGVAMRPLRSRASLAQDGKVWVTVMGQVSDGTSRLASLQVVADLYQSLAEAWVSLAGETPQTSPAHPA
ncbi:MAG: GGDEF domain-containing protein [Fimbriimonadaceae bacterium]|nr:GGDEF domain-containing protein [Fimbriimonadaceae bacterium]